MGKSIAVIDNLIKHTLTLVKQLVEGFKNSFLLKVITIFMEQYYKSILLAKWLYRKDITSKHSKSIKKKPSPEIKEIKDQEANS